MTVSTDPTKTGLANPVRVLGQSGAANALTGTTTETTLATINVPAGAMGPSGSLRITYLATCTNNANAKTITLKFGGSGVGSQSLGSLATVQGMTLVRNRTSASQAIFNNGAGPFGTSASAVVTTRAIDTTVSQDITITGTLSTGTDTLTLEAYTVELLP